MMKWTFTGIQKAIVLSIKMYKVMHKWVPNAYAWVVSGLK